MTRYMDPDELGSVELRHALRHVVQAIRAERRRQPCTMRAHLREATTDLRWALKAATARCEHYIERQIQEDADHARPTEH
mgnify:CR=1 FL=1